MKFYINNIKIYIKTFLQCIDVVCESEKSLKKNPKFQSKCICTALDIMEEEELAVHNFQDGNKDDTNGKLYIFY